MKVSVNWLSDYVDIDTTPENIAGTLSDLGFPTEGIEYLADDTIIDIEVTSNRGDCLSHIGVARELAASWGKELKIPQFDLPTCDKDITDFVEVTIEEPNLCNRYTARVICGAKVGPSPDWMKNRLEALGLRSVNNIVDATNYAMLETGQPPHAFDCDKLNGKKIVVRKAVKGERLITIDETKCDLDENMLIIADEHKPIAIAGIMGGLETEINDQTTNILLEDAHFDPVTVRTASRKLTIASDASFRFERKVDTENIDWASQRTAELIIQVAGGKLATSLADAYPKKYQPQQVSMRITKLNKLLGIVIDTETVMNILTALHLAPTLNGDNVTCTPPTWRHDITRQADLIEEVIRSHGYDNIHIERKIHIEVAPIQKREKVESAIKNFLNGCGFYEAINVSFVDPAIAGVFADDDQYLSVKDETGKASRMLRQSLIGSLMGVLKANYNAGNIPCRIFELADTFKAKTKANDSGPLPTENTILAIVADTDLRKTRGIIEGIVATVNKQGTVDLEPTKLKWAKAAANVIFQNKNIGIVGIISDETANKFSLKGTEICAAQLDFDALLDIQATDIKAKPIPKFPAVTRDLSLIVEEKIQWADIAEAVNKKAPAELEEICFTAVYRGKPIDPGKKSVTASLRFRDEDGTLTHETVDKFEESILAELKTATGAQIRK